MQNNPMTKSRARTLKMLDLFQVHNIKDPPPYFTIGTTSFSTKASFF
uniref:Uncharacterized protein n=1 Tax=Anguilla anguilla TaxID=7936 RepID=A0A0E9Q5F9_ANGAN